MSEDLPPTMRDSDRNDCGGVGGCGLMRAEHDAEVEVIACLESAARQEVVPEPVKQNPGSVVVEPTYTPAQVMAGISAALRAGDMPAVASLLRLLAGVDPDSAAAILAAVDLMSAEAAQ